MSAQDTNPLPALPAEGFIRKATVLQVIPISETVWDDGVRKGIHPQPVKLSARTVAWRVEAIREFIEKLSCGEVDLTRSRSE